MDRAFFADPAVVTASRQFVCVRLATYEDPQEVKYLAGLIRTRSGQLENSGFCAFAPDTKTRLTSAGRSPDRDFRSSAELLSAMQSWVKQYPAKGQDHRLPKIANLKLALTIAAADSLPLVVLHDAKLEDELNNLAWQDEFRGRFLYVVADDKTPLKNAKPDSRLSIVQAETFGRTGEVLASCVESTEFKATLQKAIKAFVKEQKTTRNHVQAGRTAKVFYEPPTPVTDPMEIQARERNRIKN